MIPLDIFADPVCPWCLIGKARLDNALVARPGHPFVISWQPFQLNPTMPTEGMSRADYLQAKFGQDGAVKMHVQLLEIAQAEGIDFHPERVTHQPNTRDAHRLLYWAGIEHAQGAVMEALLSAHWREGRDISDSATLCEIARAAGMDGDLTARLLASDADLDTIANKESHARQRGISAVPTFIVAERHVVSGAQPTDLWIKVIDELSSAPPEATQH
ncbi:DsbA family protein [Thioclava sp. 15-R06ZXC-3]|uniref:DsbA family protein n=1 Tax=Thioclava arctica TaxID=3238301 RepID=A0ABV3TLG8_9RHOB